MELLFLPALHKWRKKENPRYLSQQLAAIERFLDAEQPERDLISQVLDKCCKNFRYKFSQFRITGIL